MSNDSEIEKDELMVEIITPVNNDSKVHKDDTLDMEPIEFSGLKKEELMQYLKDPYWVWLRIILLTIFLLVWMSMLVIAIAVVILTPKCPARPQQEWWQQEIIYCVQVKSFLDTDQDGVGDLNGVAQKLDYIKEEVKAQAISLSYLQLDANSSSPHSATNTNFTSISSELGTIDDFQHLVKIVHKKGMKIILELNPFTTTTEHSWFERSRSKELTYKDYYLWNSLPSSGNDSSRAVMDVVRREWYLVDTHQHPLLNLGNPAVVKEISEAIKYWLGLKVDGIRIEVGRDVMELWAKGEITMKNGSYQDFTKGLLDAWSDAIEEFMHESPQSLQLSSKVLMADFEAPSNRSSERKFFQPINNHLLKIDRECQTDCVRALISDWLTSLGPASPLSNWRVSSSDAGRIASRVSPTHLNALNLLLLTLPGSQHIYYGDELAMQDAIAVSYRHNFSNSIMLWNDDQYRGFSTSKPRLPDVEGTSVKDVQAQLALGSGMSDLKVFAKLASLRQDPSVSWGTMHLGQSRDVLYHVRISEGHPCVIVVVNLGTKFATVSLKKGEISSLIPMEKATVLASTYNFQQQSHLFSDGAEVSLDRSILLEAGQGLVLKCVPESAWYA